MVLTTEKIPSLSVPHVSLNDTPGVIEVDSEVREVFKNRMPPHPTRLRQHQRVLREIEGIWAKIFHHSGLFV